MQKLINDGVPAEKIDKLKQELDEYDWAVERHKYKSTSLYTDELKASIAADDAAWEETLKAPYRNWLEGHRLNPEPFQKCDCQECEKKRAETLKQEFDRLVSPHRSEIAELRDRWMTEMPQWISYRNVDV